MSAIVIQPNGVIIVDQTIVNKSGKNFEQKIREAVNSKNYEIVRAGNKFVGFVDEDALFKPSIQLPNRIAELVLDWLLGGEENTFIGGVIHGPFVITGVIERPRCSHTATVTTTSFKNEIVIPPLFSPLSMHVSPPPLPLYPPRGDSSAVKSISVAPKLSLAGSKPLCINEEKAIVVLCRWFYRHDQYDCDPLKIPGLNKTLLHALGVDI